VLDAKVVGDCYNYLVKWKGFPASQATWETADIFATPEEAAQWWGQPAIEQDEVRKGKGEWWLLLRWETQGQHAHEVWHEATEVQQLYPTLLEEWGQGAFERRKAHVWEHGGSITESYTLPADVLADALSPTWVTVSTQYSQMIWGLYLECISADRTRNPQFKIRLPEYVFMRWLAHCGGDLLTKLVVKFVAESEEQEQNADTGVDVNEGDSAPEPPPNQLAAGQSINVEDLAAFLDLHRQANHPATQQTTAQLQETQDAPPTAQRRKVWKQVVSIEWPSVAAATTLMAGHNPHKPVAVKVSHNSLSWKWYLVSIGDVKAEYDGHCLSFTSFPIHAYQSKISNGRAYCDFKHPIYTATKRRRVDQTSS
jgi:hypothetical protein